MGSVHHSKPSKRQGVVTATDVRAGRSIHLSGPVETTRIDPIIDVLVNMCTYHYLHHHHIAPCRRAVDMVVHYVFCNDGQAKTQTPCSNLHYDHASSLDYTDPCAAGGCLVSPGCRMGECRLEQLGRHWKCCQCGRGGNKYRWCRQRMRKSPDTFCYHVCCAACKHDDSGTDGDASGSGHEDGHQHDSNKSESSRCSSGKNDTGERWLKKENLGHDMSRPDHRSYPVHFQETRVDSSSRLGG